MRTTKTAVSIALAAALVSFAPVAAFADDGTEGAQTASAVAQALDDAAGAEAPAISRDDDIELLANGEAAHLFLDTDPDAWYSAEEGRWLDYVVDNGLIKGYSDGGAAGCFGPWDNLTRGQVATILWRVAGEPSADLYVSPFVDVMDPGAYYYDAVVWASVEKIVTGRVDANGPTGRFDPDGYVTREELATMIGRYAAYVGDKDVDETYRSAAFDQAPDADSVTGFAVGWMSWCYDSKIMTGDSVTRMLSPQGIASRAVMAKMTTVLCRDVLGLPDLPTTQVEREANFLNFLQTTIDEEFAGLASLGVGYDVTLWPAKDGIQHSYWADFRLPFPTWALSAQDWADLTLSAASMSAALYELSDEAVVDLPVYVRFYDSSNTEVVRIRNGAVEYSIV